MGGPVSERGAKRRRVSASGDYDALALLRARDARVDDALGAPAVALALDALLAALRPPAEHVAAAQDALRALKAALDAMRGPLSPRAAPPAPRRVAPGDAASRKALARFGVGALATKPFGFRADVAASSSPVEPVSFVMGPPAEITVVGSFLIGTMVRSPLVVDVAVQMPDGAVQQKDYLNYRYHDKRLLFLTHLVHFLSKYHGDKFTDFAIGQHFLANDRNKPLASLTPKAAPYITIRLIPTIAEDVFDWAKLGADRRNLRPSGESSVSDSSTPAYNASIVLDSRIVRHLKTIHARVTQAPAFVDAALMLRSWMTRRYLIGGNGFVAAALLSATIDRRIAPARATKEHLFRAALGVARSGALSTLSMDGVRVAIGWDAGCCARWTNEAASALAVLDAPGAAEDAWAGVVPSLFATARGFVSRAAPLCTLFDAFVKIRRVAEGSSVFADVQPADVLSILDMALVRSSRVAHVETLAPDLYGLELYPPGSGRDPYRKIDTLPEGVDAPEFRKFWGGKVETRRFKDGRIAETIVWTGGHSVLEEITRYAFNQRFGDAIAVDVVLAQAETAAGLLGAEVGVSNANITFNELSSALRKVKGLPLTISTVLAVSPHLRGCAVQPVRPNPRGKFLEPLEILAVFEKSSAWPDDVLALASAKAAFYLALKAGLAAMGIASKACISFTDIMFGGFAFRLRLRVDNEKNISVIDKETIQRLVWETEARPTLHDAMRNIGSPVFGDTVRIVKRWLASHLLLCQFGDHADELVEILVARVFCVQHRRAPRSVFAGFCHVLHLLTEFPWEVAPLLVPLGSFLAHPSRDILVSSVGTSDNLRHDGDDDDECPQIDHAERFFASALESYKRSASDGLHMHVATPLDVSGVWFSGKTHKPERATMKRICAVASVALEFIKSELSMECPKDKAVDLSVLFRTPVDGFDGVIVIDRKWVPRSTKLISGPLRAEHVASRLDTALVGFDPVKLLVREMERSVGRFALFLYDNYGGRRIFVVWRPSAIGTSRFALPSIPFMKPLPNTDELVPNKDEMAAGIRRVCGRMAQRFDLK